MCLNLCEDNLWYNEKLVMIPEFPELKKLELKDKKDVDDFTSKFPPYADFNFSNMWAWDLKDEMRLSILNNNLVVRFTDYINGQPFFSFLGENMANETARELITFSEKNYKVNFLKLIPEIVVNFLDKSEFDTIPDKDSHDYIFSVKHLATMNSWKGHSSSKNIRQFLKAHPDYVIKVRSVQEILKDEYVSMFKRWAKSKGIEKLSEFNEFQAFERFLEIVDDKIKVVSLYKNNLLIGFTMFEICSDTYVISHFSKTDTEYHGVNDLLNWEEAKILNSLNILYANWEQDLGISVLRKSKEKYKPVFLLNKFFVREH